MRINLWIRVEDAVKGKVEPGKYWLHGKHVIEQKLLNTDDLVQVSISVDEFAELEDSKPSENDWGSEHWLKEQYNRNRSLEDHKGFKDAMDTTKEGNVIKEYLSTSGADFSEWWKSKSIAERQIITGYFGH